jgi:hypothetical protein
VVTLMPQISLKRFFVCLTLFVLSAVMLLLAHRIDSSHRHSGDLWIPVLVLRYGSFLVTGFGVGAIYKRPLLGAMFGGVYFLAMIIISDLL